MMKKAFRIGLIVTTLVMMSGLLMPAFESTADVIPAHPGDLNVDFRMIMSEAILYLSGWQQGSNPMAYAIRAAYLWQNGEHYVYNAAETPPLCWVLPAPEEGEGEIPDEGEGEVIEGENCDDGNPCTFDSYDAGLGICIHEQMNCDDGDVCTIDSCDPETGECIHTPYCETQDPCPIYTCIPVGDFPVCIFMCKDGEGE